MPSPVLLLKLVREIAEPVTFERTSPSPLLNESRFPIMREPFRFDSEIPDEDEFPLSEM